MIRSALVLTIVIMGVLGPTALEAQTGELVLHPERPEPGEQVIATYRSGLWNETHLHLRARLRSPEDGRDNDQIRTHVVTVLARNPDGSYSGAFELPPDVVYAVFGVEDRVARKTDSGEGRFWDLVVHAPHGRPLLEGLEQRFNDLLDRDERLLLPTARAMVEHYPEKVESWNTLRMAESLLGDEEYESAHARHRARVHALDTLLTQQPLSDPDQIGRLFSYAAILGERTVAERWRARLIADHPGHYFAIVDPVLRATRTHRSQPPVLLSELEGLWHVASDRPARLFIAAPAFSAARETGDTNAILLWADRLVVFDPGMSASIATDLAITDATRGEGIRWLERAITLLDPVLDLARPLGMTHSEFVRRTTGHRAMLQTQLGRALLLDGRRAEGIATLEAASLVGWDPERFRALGESRLSVADTASALHSFALAAADPSMSVSAKDSLRRSLGVNTTVWDEALAQAEIEMVMRTLADVREEVLPSIEVANRNRSLVKLESLFGESASVVVFWSRYCSYSHRAMPEIAALSDRLREQGIPVVAITRDPADASVEYLDENNWHLDAFQDLHGQAARAFSNWSTPQYFIVDGTGRIRFPFTSLRDIPRQIGALQRQETIDADSQQVREH